MNGRDDRRAQAPAPMPWEAERMNAFVRAALLASAIALPAAAAEPARPAHPHQHRHHQAPVPQVSKTGKERLSGKHSDEQRVNDCNVPPERRTRPRPAACRDARAPKPGNLGKSRRARKGARAAVNRPDAPTRAFHRRGIPL